LNHRLRVDASLVPSSWGRDEGVVSAEDANIQQFNAAFPERLARQLVLCDRAILADLKDAIEHVVSRVNLLPEKAQHPLH
jgi:hypothetical protein